MGAKLRNMAFTVDILPKGIKYYYENGIFSFYLSQTLLHLWTAFSTYLIL